MSDREHNDDFRLSCKRWAPFVWRAQANTARNEEYVAWLNRINEKNLSLILEHETRPSPPDGIAHLEGLVIEVLNCVKQVPKARAVSLSAHHVGWQEPVNQCKISRGDTGLVQIHLDPVLPFEFKCFVDIVSVKQVEGSCHINAAWMQRSDKVVDIYEQLIFIYNRRSNRDPS